MSGPMTDQQLDALVAVWFDGSRPIPEGGRDAMNRDSMADVVRVLDTIRYNEAQLTGPPVATAADFTESMTKFSEAVTIISQMAAGYRHNLLEQGWPEDMALMLSGRVLTTWQETLLPPVKGITA